MAWPKGRPRVVPPKITAQELPDMATTEDAAVVATTEQTADAVQHPTVEPDPAPKVEKVVLCPVRVRRDYWLADEQRIKAGSIVSLPGPEARRLVKEGAADRADPYPDGIPD